MDFETKANRIGQELLEKLEKTEAKLTQTELDLASEQNVRRILQAEIVEAKGDATAAKEEAAQAKEVQGALVEKQVSLIPRPSSTASVPC